MFRSLGVFFVCFVVVVLVVVCFVSAKGIVKCLTNVCYYHFEHYVSVLKNHQ